MKKNIDKLGYTLTIMAFIFIFYLYGSYFIYESDYLINGEKGTFVLSNKIEKEKLYIFEFKNFANTYFTQPTTIQLDVGCVKELRTAPTFKIVLFGEFVILSYLVSIFLFLFGLFVCLVCICRIFEIPYFKEK